MRLLRQKKNLKKKTLWPLFMDGVQLPQIFFFLQKDFTRTKHSQANINQQNKNKETKTTKAMFFLRAQTSKKVKVTCFAFWCLLWV